MAIMGIEDERPNLGKRKPLVYVRPAGLGVDGLTGDEDMYEPVLGRMTMDSGGGGSTTSTKTMTAEEKAQIAANKAQTEATFNAMNESVKQQTAAKAAAQQAAKAQAIAEAQAAGKSQAEIDKAAKAAITRVALEQPIIVASTESRTPVPVKTTTVKTTNKPQTGPMIATPVPSFWDNLFKAWDDLMKNVKKTLNVK